MRAVFSVAAFAAFAVAGSASVYATDPGPRLSGPHVHENLAVYFVHGPSTAGPVPLTLAEALEKRTVRVIETGNVNALMVENLGQEAVFIQSGDIVKGGQQDRVLTISLLLPAQSGKVAIDSFCVEQGRWAPRGKEDVKEFKSAAEALPSRTAKLAMKVPPKVAEAAPPPEAGQQAGARQGIVAGDATQRRTLGALSSQANDTSVKQRKVWDEVATIQSGLSARLGAKVAAPQSATSLQLSLENAELKKARADYVAALETAAHGQNDVVGFVFAIDGKINSADVYPSEGLFRKMWPKLLAASVTEAIGSRSAAQAKASAPVISDVQAFLTQAEAGKTHEMPIAKLMKQETRDADSALYVESRTASGAWVHRNYLAK